VIRIRRFWLSAMSSAGAGDAVVVHDAVAGLASTLPAVSTARTENVCAPVDRLEYVCGEVHAANAAPSRLHWNDPGSEAVKEIDAVGLATFPDGAEVTVVSGAVVSEPVAVSVTSST